MTSLTKISCYSIQEVMEAGVNSVGCLSLNGNFFRIRVAYFRSGNPNSFPLIFPVRNIPFWKNTPVRMDATLLHFAGSPLFSRQSALFLGVVWYPMIS